jgi:hypothetical protein
MGIQLVSAWCADEEASQTHDPADLPPFPVIHPDVTCDGTTVGYGGEFDQFLRNAFRAHFLLIRLYREAASF